VVLQPDAALPAEITIDYDDGSSSNAGAITHVQAATGWAGKVITETEYLCTYDAQSWRGSDCAVGVPPSGCAVVPQ
jgi:hypothetical protein